MARKEQRNINKRNFFYSPFFIPFSLCAKRKGLFMLYSCECYSAKYP